MNDTPESLVENIPPKRMTLLPFRVTEQFEAGSIITYVMPWQAPALMGVAGKIASRPDRVAAVVGFEWPLQHLVLSNPISQQELERIHLNRFFTDYLLLKGEPPFTNIVATLPGEDPPDFTVTTATGPEEIDCVQFTVQSRRTVNAAFRVIREEILRQPRERFCHLAGHIVYMWFGGGENDLGLPPRPTNRSEVTRIVDALAAHHIDPNAFQYQPENAEEGLPEKFDNVAFDSSQPGTTFYAMPMQGAVPTSSFFIHTGFETGMAYSTTDDAHSVWSELERIIRRHDKPGISHLIVTVGGPDQGGFVYPAEAYLMDVALADHRRIEGLAHLTHVTLHLWSSGTIVELFPEIVVLGAVYPGTYSVAYFTATVTPASPQGSSFQWVFFDSAENEAPNTDHTSSDPSS